MDIHRGYLDKKVAVDTREVERTLLIGFSSPPTHVLSPSQALSGCAGTGAACAVVYAPDSGGQRIGAVAAVVGHMCVYGRRDGGWAVARSLETI